MDDDANPADYVLMETRPRVLAKFFEQSRDNWKRKCQAALADVKQFRDKVRDVLESRQMWCERAEQSEQERRRLAAEVQQLRAQLAVANATLEKKVAAAT